eukprot:gnl/Hemi2/25209_TR8473_c0_g1_i1.p1 gnl/Hemi2/25209_TR8473_c0_g1~~gnl/Hemi2/25209_TR8473_c0_g1_i1.p1  ORF type:complete len:343 (-),score=81.81 gnl/Hemi2/25209_TR8473_c0_g1_i1:99-1127(-)
MQAGRLFVLCWRVWAVTAAVLTAFAAATPRGSEPAPHASVLNVRTEIQDILADVIIQTFDNATNGNSHRLPPVEAQTLLADRPLMAALELLVERYVVLQAAHTAAGPDDTNGEQMPLMPMPNLANPAQLAQLFALARQQQLMAAARAPAAQLMMQQQQRGMMQQQQQQQHQRQMVQLAQMPQGSYNPLMPGLNRNVLQSAAAAARSLPTMQDRLALAMAAMSRTAKYPAKYPAQAKAAAAQRWSLFGSSSSSSKAKDPPPPPPPPPLSHGFDAPAPQSTFSDDESLLTDYSPGHKKNIFDDVPGPVYRGGGFPALHPSQGPVQTDQYWRNFWTEFCRDACAS